MEECLVPRYSVCDDYLLTGAAPDDAEGRVLGKQPLWIFVRVYYIYVLMGVAGHGSQMWSGAWCGAQRADDIQRGT